MGEAAPPTKGRSMIDFTRTITEWRDGALVIEANEKLQEVIQACVDTGKAGSIQMSLKIEPEPTKNGGCVVKVTPKVETKNPKFDPGIGFFHVVTDEAGKTVGLEREDPAQQKLFEQMERSN